MRVALIVVASLALAFLTLWELGISYPVPGWIYLLVAIFFTIALVRGRPPRQQANQLRSLTAILIAICTLYFIDWNTRKPFLRDLARVRPGMTEAEVRNLMRHYIEGTGWGPIPGGPSNAPGTLNILGSGSQYATEISPAGQMVISNSLVFRHSNEGAFNADWGIVSFSAGKVVSVEFSPD